MPTSKMGKLEKSKGDYMLNQCKQMSISEYERKAFHFDASSCIETQIAYSILSDQVIASVFKDKIDNNFHAVISNYSMFTKSYKCTWLSDEYDDIEGAMNQLELEISHRKELYEASIGKPSKFDKVNPFILGNPKHEKYSPYLSYIYENQSWQAARMMIIEALEKFVDADGNFIEQFQTTAFDQRLWELYLNTYFDEEGFSVDKSKAIPDFIISKEGVKIGVEAVTSANKNPSTSPTQETITEMTKEIRDEIFLGYSSALTSNKLARKYWDLDYLSGCPLVFAVENFRTNFALMNGTSVLCDYLYGLEPDPTKTTFEHVKGRDVIKANGSVVNTGFFYLPEAENVSAVITSAQGTLPKFNRIGIYKGYGPANVYGFQYANLYNREPNARKPKPDCRLISPGMGAESWAEGIAIYHNPNAKIKLPYELFPNASHTSQKGAYLYSVIPTDFSFNSLTSFFEIRT